MTISSSTGQVIITDSEALRQALNDSHSNESFTVIGNVRVVSDELTAQKKAEIDFKNLVNSDIPAMIKKLTQRLVKNASSLEENATNQFVHGFTGLSSVFSSRINQAQEIQKNDEGLMKPEDIFKEKEKLQLLIDRKKDFIAILETRNELLKNQIELTKKNGDCFEQSIQYTQEAIKNFERFIVVVAEEEIQGPGELPITSDRVAETVEKTLKHAGRMASSMSNIHLLRPKEEISLIFKKQLTVTQEINALNTNELSHLEKQLIVLLKEVESAKKISLKIEQETKSFFKKPGNALPLDKELSVASETTPMHLSSNLISSTDALKVEIEHFNTIKGILSAKEKSDKQIFLHSKINELKTHLEEVTRMQHIFKTEGDGSKLKMHESELKKNQERIQDINTKGTELDAILHPKPQSSLLGWGLSFFRSSSSSKEPEIVEEVEEKSEEIQETEDKASTEAELQETNA